MRLFGALDDDSLKEYTEYIYALRAGRVHTKESTHFQENYVPSEWALQRGDVTDFWWDIQNDVMFSFHKVFMNRIVSYVSASLAYMDEQKAKHA